MPKLLLADDSVTIQRVIELTFADEDIQVVAVGDGKQAIARIDAERPDVVLADIGMPERDGYEVAAHVKGNPQTAHIPVLLLTGAFEPIDEARARAVGCDGVLVKPFEPQMLINRVKDLLAGRRPASLWSTPAAAGGAAVTPPQAAAADAAGQPHDAGKPRTDGAKESLDDYFDRLDAAFSNEVVSPPQFDAPPAAAPAPPADRHSDFGAWDIPVEAKPRQPEPPPARPEIAPAPERTAEPPVQRASFPVIPERREIPAIAPEMPPVAQAPALADAFAALLAAEQKIGGPSSSSAAPAAAPATLDDQTIEEIVRRVIARLSDDVVRSTVLDVAERLVREEIDRIKKQARL